VPPDEVIDPIFGAHKTWLTLKPARLWAGNPCGLLSPNVSLSMSKRFDLPPYDVIFDQNSDTITKKNNSSARICYGNPLKSSVPK
jgi:hypothetical protein